MKEEIVKALKITGLDKKEIEDLVEVPKDKALGDFAFPCFVLAKKEKKNPFKIAEELAEKISKNKAFEKVEASGAYVNFFIDSVSFSKEVLKEALKKDYGSGKEKKKIMVEFSQPNTHKAFHVGHIRGTTLGESLARILEFKGNKVVRANYSGDTGMHIAKWIWCYKKFHAKEKIQENESWFANIYAESVKKLEDNKKGQEEVEEINRKIESKEDKAINELWKKTREMSIKSWEDIYKDLGVKFDIHLFESQVDKEGKEIAQELVKKGIAKTSDGATIMDLKEYGLAVWVLLRSDGTVLYSAKDLALAKKKFEEYKLDKSLIITDSAQDLHFRQLIKTLELMKFNKAENYEHKSYGPIRFPWGKMSSRTGDNVLYNQFKEDTIKEAEIEIQERFKIGKKELRERAMAVSLAAIKYWVLKQEMNKILLYNPKEVLSFEGNTGPYLLYSYARANSILKKAKSIKKKEIDFLDNAERLLITEISRFPEVVDNAYRNLAPNLIANYCYELSKAFNEFYHECPVIGSDKEDFRVSLVKAFSVVLDKSLGLLGIKTIEEM